VCVCVCVCVCIFSCVVTTCYHNNGEVAAFFCYPTVLFFHPSFMPLIVHHSRIPNIATGIKWWWLDCDEPCDYSGRIAAGDRLMWRNGTLPDVLVGAQCVIALLPALPRLIFSTSTLAQYQRARICFPSYLSHFVDHVLAAPPLCLWHPECGCLLDHNCGWLFDHIPLNLYLSAGLHFTAMAWFPAPNRRKTKTKNKAFL
jgi:hypothetical protein